MRIHKQCINCILTVRIREINESIGSDERAVEIQKVLLKISHEEFTKENELTIIASNIFRRLLAIAPEIERYYKELKTKAIDAAWKQFPTYEDFLENFQGYEKFRYAVKVSIAGNTLDTGVAGHIPPENISIEHILSTPLIIDQTLEIYDLVKGGGKKITWLFDNAGEAVLDVLPVKIIREYGNEVVGIAKADPGFQNDLTISDAYYAGLDKYFDKLLSTGYAGSSIHLERIDQKVLEEIRSSDLVVAKGMANFEYLSEIELGVPVVFLLIPKCEVVSHAVKAPRRYFVAFLRS